MATCLTRFLTFAPVAVLAIDCSPPPERPARAPGGDGAAGSEPIEIRTDRTTYRAGDSIELTVANRGPDTLTFNPCTRTLELDRNGVWEPLREADRVCTMEAWILAPGKTREGRTELPPEPPAGRYRVQLGFGVEGGTRAGTRLTARSAPVTVQR